MGNLHRGSAIVDGGDGLFFLERRGLFGQILGSYQKNPPSCRHAIMHPARTPPPNRQRHRHLASPDRLGEHSSDNMHGQVR